MLILTRKSGQSVFIGNNIRCSILGVNGNQVKIGFDAPPDLPIYREEIYKKMLGEQIKNENHGSAKE
jgi:carbon storage regulator CsrA